MFYKLTAITVVVLIISVAVPCEGLGADIYFDVDADLLPDTECTMNVGDEIVLLVCLSNFTEETGSFQFDMFYDGSILTLLDYDAYMGQPDEDPSLPGIIQTKAELGPWATAQWTEPVTQEVNEYDAGSGGMREFYAAGSFTQTATGDGILAYLVFEAIGVGETMFHLEMPGDTWFLEGASQQPTPTDLTVTVIPEPPVLLLVLLTAGFLGRRWSPTGIT